MSNHCAASFHRDWQGQVLLQWHLSGANTKYPERVKGALQYEEQRDDETEDAFSVRMYHLRKSL